MLLKLCHVDICSPQKTFRVFNICLFWNILGKKLKNPKKMKTFSSIFGGIFQFLTGDNAIDYPRALFKRGGKPSPPPSPPPRTFHRVFSPLQAAKISDNLGFYTKFNDPPLVLPSLSNIPPPSPPLNISWGFQHAQAEKISDNLGFYRTPVCGWNL